MDEVHRGRGAPAAGDAAGHLPSVGGHVAAGRAGDSSQEGEVGMQPFVHSRCTGAFAGPCLNDLRLSAGPFPECPVGVNGVAAEVHQRTAGELEGPARVARAGVRHEHVRLDVGELTELAGCQQVAEAAKDGVVEVMEAVGDHDAGLVSRVAHLSRLKGVGREGLVFVDGDNIEAAKLIAVHPLRIEEQRSLPDLGDGGLEVQAASKLHGDRFELLYRRFVRSLRDADVQLSVDREHVAAVQRPGRVDVAQFSIALQDRGDRFCFAAS